MAQTWLEDNDDDELHALDWDRESTKIYNHFKKGMAHCFSEHLSKWLTLNMEARRISQQQLANWVGVDRATVNKWCNNRHDMTLANLAILVTMLEPYTAKFPESVGKPLKFEHHVPGHIEMIMHGYSSAMSYIRGVKIELGLEKFWSLFYLFDDKNLINASRDDFDRMEEVAKRVISRVESKLGHRVLNLGQLRHLAFEWGPAWIKVSMCIDNIYKSIS